MKPGPREKSGKNVRKKLCVRRRAPAVRRIRGDTFGLFVPSTIPMETRDTDSTD